MGFGTRSTVLSVMASYIQGPEPTGWLESSSSVVPAGKTRTSARRSLSSEKLAMAVVTVMVVSSVASSASIGARNAE